MSALTCPDSTPSTTVLCKGRPRFADAGLAARARADGEPAAWALALAGDAAAALAQVGGEFAVGLRMATGRTVLAVDRFGIQTLCYRVIDGQLHFDERADVLAQRAPAAPLDPQALFDYLYHHVIPSPRTVFEGVQRLPPGHMAVFESGRLRVQPYWVPTFHEPARANFAELAADFRSRLQQAVAAQLDGSKPACFLSGGTDSSTVAGMMGLAAGRPAATYSIGFEAEGYDEMQYARIAAQRFGTEHHEYYVTPDDVTRSLPAVAAHFDQPFGNSSALPAYYCAQVAHADGVTRMLAGDGGDELFGGNARYAKQRIFGWYRHLPRPLRAGLEPLLGQPWAQRVAPLRKAASYVEQARIPMPDRLEQYNLLLRLQPHQVLTPALLAHVELASPVRQQQAVWQAVTQGSELNRTLAFDWRYTLGEADLPKVRGATQMAGVAVGFPFLDAELLDFSLRLPSNYKLKGLKLRWFFKEALRGFLPDEIIAKRKQGFGLPFGVWATRHAPLRGVATDALHSLARRGIVQPAFIDKLLVEQLPAHPGYYGEMVWILTVLELWLQHQRPDWRL
jgi:asparagine synthase (glutamine-hydrolysing)